MVNLGRILPGIFGEEEGDFGWGVSVMHGGRMEERECGQERGSKRERMYFLSCFW